MPQLLNAPGIFVLANNGQATLYNQSSAAGGVPLLPGVYRAFGFSSNSRYFLYLKAKNKFPTFDLYCYDLRTGLERKIAGQVHRAVWSPAGQLFSYYWLDSSNQAHLDIFDLTNNSSTSAAAGNIRMDSIAWSPNGLELLYVNADPAPPPVPLDNRFTNNLHRRLWRSGVEAVLPGVAAARFVGNQLFVLGGTVPSSASALPNPAGENIRTFVVAAGRIYAEMTEAGGPVVKRWNPNANNYEFVANGGIFDSTDNGVAVRSFGGRGTQFNLVSSTGTITTAQLAPTGSSWELPFAGWAYIVQGGDLYSGGACDGATCFITAHKRQLGYALDWQQHTELNQGNIHILAVADGTVAAITNNMTCNTQSPTCSVGWDDYSTTCNDFTNGAGNHVVIAHLDGTYSFYGHLRSGSVQVAPGQAVVQGTYLGDQGHSGVAGTYNNYLNCGDHVHFSRQIGPAVWDQSIPTDFTETPCALSCPAAYQSANVEVAPAPGLTSVTPANGVPGSSVPITLTGTNFLYGSTVAVTGTGVSISNVALTSATTITANLSVAAGAAPGSYDLTVTTTSGVSNAQPFTVASSPDFAIVPAPTAKSIAPGTSSTFIVNVSSLGGFAGNVALSASGMPTGMTASFSPAAVAAGSSSVMTVDTGGGPPLGTYPLAITGVSGLITRTATISVTVPVAPDYALTSGPASQILATGGSVGYAVSLMALNGFSGTVSLSVTGLPAGASAVFSPTSLSAGQTSALTVTAPAGTAPGSYTLTITATSGTLVRSDSIAVGIVAAGSGGSLIGSLGSPPSTQSLTSLGTEDWVHWGNGAAAILDRKSGVTQEISDYTTVGFGAVSAYQANLVTYTWTDGTPTASASAATGVYVSGWNRGYQITVPADTSPRTLNLFVGVWRTQGKLTAHLSDGSAADYVSTALNNGSATSNGVYTLIYRAASAGQTLVVTYTQASNTTGNLTLQAAALASGGATPDFSMSATPSSQQVANGSSGTFSVTVTPINSFSGTVGLGVSGLPSGATANFVPASISGGGSSTMIVTVGSSVALGTYPLTITGVSGSLSHTAGVSLTVTPPPSGGTLTGTLATPVGTQDLTLLGTTDWAHWGLTSASSFDHKSGAAEHISNISVVGGNPLNRVLHNPIGYSWTDGTPTVSATNTPTGVYIIGPNNGLRFSAPADGTQRTLRVFVGLWSAQGKFTAHLSDGSAPDFIDTSLNNGSGTSLGLYTLTYAAASPGQTLTITYTAQSTTSPWGNVTLEAATLGP